MTQKEKVMPLIDMRDWEGLARMLSGLSNMELRRMERVMREEVLTKLENEPFWETLLHIIIFKRAAFLSGASAVEHLAEDGTLDFETEGVRRLYEHLRETNAESLVKICNIMLPALKDEKQVAGAWKAFHIDDEVTRLSMLLKVDSTLSYFLIFKILKMIEDKVIAHRCCTTLMRRQDDRAFNAVSLIKAYFGLDDLSGRFSLSIEQYELSHIDRDFATFEHVLNGKRPRI